MNKNSKKSRKEQYKEKRKELIARSVLIRQMVKEGAIDTVNEGLRELYTDENPDIEEFNTFNQWKEQGYTIKKGSKAFLFWGQPRHYEQTPEGSDEPEEFKFWPLCYLFSNEQVFKKGETPQEPQPEQRHQPREVENFEESLL
jgi:hypothetical protein